MRKRSKRQAGAVVGSAILCLGLTAQPARAEDSPPPGPSLIVMLTPIATEPPTAPAQPTDPAPSEAPTFPADPDSPLPSDLATVPAQEQTPAQEPPPSIEPAPGRPAEFAVPVIRPAVPKMLIEVLAPVPEAETSVESAAAVPSASAPVPSHTASPTEAPTPVAGAQELHAVVAAATGSPFAVQLLTVLGLLTAGYLYFRALGSKRSGVGRNPGNSP